MKYILSIIFFWVFCGNSFSQDIVLLKTKDFTGVIFPENYAYKEVFLKSQKRFTPIQNEILKVEAELKLQIHDLNKSRLNQKGRNPVIDRKLKKYVRQYCGYYNQKGERIIYINCIWKTYTEIGMDNIEREVWRTDWQTIFDGGSNYWNIKYNLDTKSFCDLAVNGFG